jgi:pimeloyl-ACP methyl ester carboxylesterase
MSDARVVHAYLHGFGSGASSPLAVALREACAARGLELLVPDLERPSLRALSIQAAWAHLESLDEAMGHPRWRVVGSSLGGWLAARMASRWGRVDRAVLLAAPRELRALWDRLVPEAARDAWRTKGSILLPDARGRFQRIGYGFYEDVVALGSEPSPPMPCPTLFVHGARDVLVPLESSRAQAEASGGALWILDDDHELTGSTSVVVERALAFLEVAGPHAPA